MSAASFFLFQELAKDAVDEKDITVIMKRLPDIKAELTDEKDRFKRGNARPSHLTSSTHALINGCPFYATPQIRRSSLLSPV